MENLSTYLPDSSTATLEPFFAAYNNANPNYITQFIIDHVRSVAADIEGATEQQILEDIGNLDTAIKGFCEDIWEDRESAINEANELDELAQDY